MNRVILINKTKVPSRHELVTSERRTGELLFARFPELKFAGYVIERNRLAANWIIAPESYDAFKQFAESIECLDYDVLLYTNGTNQFGGQTEVRVL